MPTYLPQAAYTIIFVAIGVLSSALLSWKRTLISHSLEKPVGLNEQVEQRPIDASRNGARPTSSGGPIIVGVAGASGSGKTSLGGLVAARLRALHVEAACVDISCDQYYRTLPSDADASKYNFDHPQALDWDLLVEQLTALRTGQMVCVPSYSFVHHARGPAASGRHIDGHATDVIILDGIFVLWDPRVRALLDIAVFCSEDLDVCLARRIRRDIAERGRSVDSVLLQYLSFVRPGYSSFVAPSMQYADIIIPRAKDNVTAIGLLARECAAKVVARLGREGDGMAPMAFRDSQADETGAGTPRVTFTGTPALAFRSRLTGSN